MAITMTSSKAYIVQSRLCLSVIVVLTTALCGVGTAGAGSDIGTPRTGEPALQRLKVVDGGTYFFDFAVPRGKGSPALEKLPVVSELHEGQAAIRYFLFGAMEGANTPRFPLRWDIAENTLLCTFKMLEAHQPTGPSLFRYPLDAVVVGPDDGRWPLDPNKVPGRFNESRGFSAPNYVGCNPIGEALQGFHRGWREGKNRVGEPAKVVHYDIRALDDYRVELYMTADGELFKWLYDGKTWKYERDYAVKIPNEFLILGNGKSLLTDQDGGWCIVRDIEREDATFDPIVDRVEGEPLTLVEDKVEQKTFFLHRDRLLDDTGRELFTARASRDHTDRLRKVIDFVLSRRVPRP